MDLKETTIISHWTKRLTALFALVLVFTLQCVVPTVLVDCVWNVMAHAQKPEFVFRRNGWVHLNRRGRQFSRLLAAEACASVEVMLDTPHSEVVWRVLATHSIRQFPLHFPIHASPCTITFQPEYTLPLISVYLVYLIHSVHILILLNDHMQLTSYSNLHFYSSKFS